MNVSRGTNSGRCDDVLVAYSILVDAFEGRVRLARRRCPQFPIYHDRRLAMQMLLNSNSFAVQRHFRATKRAHVQKRGCRPEMLLLNA